jgi:Pyruvate/2-oxoacid:ferredoxin oxidoreductase delta subunit
MGEKKKRPREVAFMDVNLCFPCGKCPEFCPVQCIEYLAPDTLPGRGVQPVQDRFQECIGCYICAEVVRSCLHLRPHTNMSQNCLQGDGRFFRRRFGILLYEILFTTTNVTSSFCPPPPVNATTLSMMPRVIS